MKDPCLIYKNFKVKRLKAGKLIDGRYSSNKYHNYISSKKWKQKSYSMRKKYPFCYVCKTRDNLRVHHITYKNLKKEKEWDLIVLCSYCHNEVHNLILNEKEVKLKTAHKVYKKLKSLEI